MPVSCACCLLLRGFLHLVRLLTLLPFARILFSGKPQPDFALVQAALPVLARLLYVLDDEVLTDACWALSYMSDDTGSQNNKIEAVIHCGVARRLVELLMHKSANVKKPALRTVGNIATGDDVQMQVLLVKLTAQTSRGRCTLTSHQSVHFPAFPFAFLSQNCSALPCLLALLVNPKKSIRKEACWSVSGGRSNEGDLQRLRASLLIFSPSIPCSMRTISNITAGNEAQIDLVIGANIIPPLVAILKEEHIDIQKVPPLKAEQQQAKARTLQAINADSIAHSLLAVCAMQEAVWALGNAASGGTDEQVRYLAAQGAIPPLCRMLSRDDATVVSTAMEGQSEASGH